MFNEADFVISILNSDNETDKRNVDEMCKLTSCAIQMIIMNSNLFCKEVNIFFNISKLKYPTVF